LKTQLSLHQGNLIAMRIASAGNLGQGFISVERSRFGSQAISKKHETALLVPCQQAWRSFSDNATLRPREVLQWFFSFLERDLLGFIAALVSDYWFRKTRLRGRQYRIFL
jgi:hypothetical protein